jgi:predicted nucleic acid-binding protein
MSGVVVDTDVASFLFKDHSSARLYDLEIQGRIAHISFMTMAELRRWILQAGWGERRSQSLRDNLERFTVVPSSPDLCDKWAEVTVAAQAAGRRIDCADAWIAATALLYDFPLITHNRGDYLGVPGLRIISHA